MPHVPAGHPDWVPGSNGPEWSDSSHETGQTIAQGWRYFHIGAIAAAALLSRLPERFIPPCWRACCSEEEGKQLMSSSIP